MRRLGYGDAGVADQGSALSGMTRRLAPTFGLPSGAEVISRFGHYASVLKISDEIAIAVCTDGVGTKTMVASMLDRYDTIGIDCVAMNVNDLLCVGAHPVAMVDYLGVHTLDERRAESIAQGLAAGAEEARIAIPGGEIAQLPEVIGSDGSSPDDERAFDLVGTCIGTLHPDGLVLGELIAPGDALVAIASSGIHSNGFTLARRVLLSEAGFDLHDRPPQLARALGEELLRPTAIYVRPVEAMWDEGIETRGLAHITGDGLSNLCRLKHDVGFVVESLPEPPPIFDLIRSAGSVGDEEMFRAFNMGVGFVVVVAPEQEQSAIAAIEGSGHRAAHLGYVSDDPGSVVLEPAGLAGTLSGGFERLQRVGGRP